MNFALKKGIAFQIVIPDKIIIFAGNIVDLNFLLKNSQKLLLDFHRENITGNQLII